MVTCTLGAWQDGSAGCVCSILSIAHKHGQTGRRTGAPVRLLHTSAWSEEDAPGERGLLGRLSEMHLNICWSAGVAARLLPEHKMQGTQEAAQAASGRRPANGCMWQGGRALGCIPAALHLEHAPGFGITLLHRHAVGAARAGRMWPQREDAHLRFLQPCVQQASAHHTAL